MSACANTWQMSCVRLTDSVGGRFYGDPMSLASAPTAAELPTPVIGTLSPSRASDFKTCPLLYRFRSIDRLPEAPSRSATRGTVVHAVLEELFGLPSAERTIERARAMRVLAVESRTRSAG